MPAPLPRAAEHDRLDRDLGGPAKAMLLWSNAGFPGAAVVNRKRRDLLVFGDRGGVAEWLKAADCKSVDVRLRRFESYPLHHRLMVADRSQGIAAGPDGAGIGVANRRDGDRLAGVAQW
jgi:hypothetical protein